MFVGHGLLAFALVATAARLWGWSPERALQVGLLAGVFGLAPDVDILYAPVGVLGANGPLDAAAGFWHAGNRVHRAVTHSILVGSVASLAAGVWATGRPGARALAAGTLAATTLVAVAVSGVLGGVVLAAFGATVLGLARVGRVRQGLGPAAVAAAAAVGTLTHPFGDLFTGEPPALLYPLDAGLLTGRVTLHPDPTLHLLGALFVELGTAWLAAVVLLWCRGTSPGRPVRTVADRLRRTVDGRAGLAVGYVGAAAVLPAPTLEVSYHFVFPLLGVGLAATVVAATRSRPAPSAPADRWAGLERAALSGLTAVTLAALAYTAGYLLLG